MNLQAAHSSLGYNSAFLGEDGSLWMWGKNVGEIWEEDKSTPQPLVLLPSPSGEPFQLAEISCESDHILALGEDSRIFVWGANSHGELGLGDFSTYNGIHQLKLLPEKKYSRVLTGCSFSLALATDGILYAWGENVNGQLGQGHLDNLPTPHVVPIPDPVVSVACGTHVLALTNKGVLYTWGFSDNGECGLGFSKSDVENPSIVSGIPSPIAKVFAGFHSMALTTNGDLYTWGWGEQGSLGLGDTENRDTPKFLMSRVVDAACGGGHAFVIMEDGTIKGWGCNGHGQLGLGQTCATTSPVDLPLSVELRKENKRVASIGATYDHSFLVTDDGELYMWGLGTHGELGILGDLRDHTVPQKMWLKVLVPWRCKMKKEWEEIFQWLFLGRTRGDASLFSYLPVEVIFHFVQLRF
jgi:alpha-tubulin suppressor-like RCC1 family protein